MVVDVAAEGDADGLGILQGHVVGSADIVEVVVFEHQVVDTGAGARIGDADGVMPRIDVEELHLERCLGAVADLEAEHLLVQVAHPFEMRGHQRHMADAHVAGAEPADGAPRLES
ncbi:hypothetical protein D3C85_1313680 [compost metagenome]